MTISRPAALAVIMLLAWAAIARALFGGIFPSDQSAVYAAAWAHARDLPHLVYAAPEGVFSPELMPQWDGIAAEMGVANEPLVPYVYPPLWVALLAPLTHVVTMRGFLLAVSLFHLAVMVATPFLAREIAGRRGRPELWAAAAIAVYLFTVPGLLILMHSQPQITVGALVLAAFLAAGKGRDVPAGMLLGLAAAIKVTPILLVALFLRAGRPRAALSALATAAALAALSVALAGWPLHMAFLERLSGISAGTVLTDFNYSVPLALHELRGLITGLPGGQRPIIGIAADPVIPGRLGLALGLALLAAALIPRLDLADPAQRTRALLAALLAVPLFAPLAWAHYYTLPMLFLPALPWLLGRTGWALAVLLPLLTLYPLYDALHRLPGPRYLAVLAPVAILVLTLATLLVPPRRR